MVMQWPGDRAIPSSISAHCASLTLPARFSAQYFHTSEPLPSGWSRQLPRSIGPAGMKIAGRFMLIAPISNAGVVLSQPPINTAPSTGYERKQLLGFEREQVAVEHRGRLLEHFGQRDRRHLQREAARLQHAALDLLGALPEMRVTGVDVAPGVDDGDDRLAEIVAARIAHLRGARMMPELAQVARAEPAVRAQLLGFFARAHAAWVAALPSITPGRAQAAPAPRCESPHDAQRRGWTAAAAMAPYRRCRRA